MTQIAIGTRGSRLALWQARHVEELVARASGAAAQIKVIRTAGDADAETPLDRLERGVFTSEIERALLSGEIDCAVHSLKDMPTDEVEGLEIAAVLPRHDAAEALVSKRGLTLAALPEGARVLTGSLRREALLLNLRPDVKTLPVRGNVDRRVRKLDEGDADALILARAGLDRLGLSHRTSERLDPWEFVPACGQGAIAVQVRSNDGRAKRLVAPLDDFKSRAATTAERAFLATLGGGCQLPIAAYAEFAGGPFLEMAGVVADAAGRRIVRRTMTSGIGRIEDAVELGRRLGGMVLAEGGGEILESFEASAGRGAAE